VRTFLVPVPPSTNQLYAGRRWKSAAYEAWIKAAGWTIIAAQPTMRNPIAGPFQLTIDLPPGRMDIDNIKALPDLLSKMFIISDDSPKHMKRLVVQTDPALNGECRLTLEPLP